jgi:hypothetical protein
MQIVPQSFIKVALNLIIRRDYTQRLQKFVNSRKRTLVGQIKTGRRVD